MTDHRYEVQIPAHVTRTAMGVENDIGHCNIKVIVFAQDAHLAVEKLGIALQSACVDHAEDVGEGDALVARLRAERDEAKREAEAQKKAAAERGEQSDRTSEGVLRTLQEIACVPSHTSWAETLHALRQLRVEHGERTIALAQARNAGADVIAELRGALDQADRNARETHAKLEALRDEAAALTGDVARARTNLTDTERELAEEKRACAAHRLSGEQAAAAWCLLRSNVGGGPTATWSEYAVIVAGIVGSLRSKVATLEERVARERTAAIRASRPDDDLIAKEVADALEVERDYVADIVSDALRKRARSAKTAGKP